MPHRFLMKINSGYESKAALRNKLYINKGGCLLAMGFVLSVCLEVITCKIQRAIKFNRNCFTISRG